MEWRNSLHGLNHGKEGAAYRYPDSFVQLLGYMRVYFHLPYRQTEGVVRAHSNNKVPAVPDYSTINRRVNKLEIKKQLLSVMDKEKFQQHAAA